MKIRELLSQCEVGDAVLIDAMMDAPPNEQLEEPDPDPVTRKIPDVPFYSQPGRDPWFFSLSEIPMGEDDTSFGWVRQS